MLDYTKKDLQELEQRSQHVRSTNNQGFGKKQPACIKKEKRKSKLS